MKTLSIEFGQDVEHEGIGVVIQGFVIEKQLRQETHLMRVGLVLPAINFKEGNGSMTIDLIARGMSQCALRLETPIHH